jgi:hypothetical protein
VPQSNTSREKAQALMAETETRIRDADQFREFTSVSNDVFLAALGRAVSHARDGYVTRGMLAEQLGFTPGTSTTLKLRPQVSELIMKGLIQRRHGGFELTPKGRARLARVRRAGKPLPLPESPQHFRWRRERTNAPADLAMYRAKIKETVKELNALLNDSTSPAAAWIDLAKKLKERCLRLAYAKHCVDDWEEPDDCHPDPHELPPRLASAVLPYPPKHG